MCEIDFFVFLFFCFVVFFYSPQKESITEKGKNQVYVESVSNVRCSLLKKKENGNQIILPFAANEDFAWKSIVY